MRALRLFSWFLFGVGLAFVWLVPPARAESIAATLSNGEAGWSRGPSTYRGASLIAACTALWPGHTYVLHQLSSTDYSCWYQFPGGSWGIEGGLTPWCPPDMQNCYVSSWQSLGQSKTQYSCPAGQNWTLSGQNCTRPDCVAGQGRTTADGVCRTACGVGADGNFDKPYTVAGSSMPDSICVNGCFYGWRSVAVCGKGKCAATLGKGTGVSCSTSTVGTGGVTAPTNTPAAEGVAGPAADCILAGQTFGTVNGVVACTGKADSTQKQTTVVNTQTNPDGSTSSTTRTDKTTCVGGDCTSTSSTTNVGGGSPGAGAGSPGSSAAGSSPNGTTAGQSVESQDTYCEKHPTAVQCLGTVDSSEDLGSKDLTQSISPVSVPGDFTCPSPVSLPKGLTFSWTPICSAAGMARPVVVAFAWLSAGLIVIGGVRGG